MEHRVHRVEVLHRGENDRREYWSDRCGRVVLVRRRAEATWGVLLDGQRVVVLADGGQETLAATSREEAALHLALEEGLHLVFDAEEVWQPDATGWPARLVRRPPRPGRGHDGHAMSAPGPA